MSTEAAPADRRPERRWSAALLARVDAPIVAGIAAVVVALIVRGLVAASDKLALFDADQAVTGIAAQQILAGEEFPVFFPGQTYMGTLEQYLQAVSLAVFPDTSFSLQLVQVLIGGATVAVLFFVGRQVTYSAWGGALAAGLFALGPFFNLDKGVKSHGAYAAGTLIAVIGLYLAFRLDPKRRDAVLVAAGLGLCTGLALWELVLAGYLLLPATIWALASARGQLKLLAPAWLGGALIGAAPFLAHRLVNPDAALGSLGENPPTTIAERAGLLFEPMLGMWFGVRGTGPGEPLSWWLVPAFVAAIAIAILGAGIWSRRRGLLALVTFRREGRAPIDAILLAFLVAPIVYVSSDVTWFTGTPRYLFPLYPALVLGIAAAVMFQGQRWRLPLGVACIVVMGGLSLWNASLVLRGDPAVITSVGGGQIWIEDVPAATDYLSDNGIETAYADYWLAYPMTFYGGGDVDVAPFANSRFPDIDARAAEDPDSAFAAPIGPAADQVQARLTETGTDFARTDVGRITIFSELSPPRTPAELGLMP